ncbi:pimeloyl-ACP methyl ester carboxylesterase [Microbacterium sp. SORGH_AS 1204]|uniref:alpha/beta hydrolase n=1 Tax=Microbacterium sp. SORGH_AS_1204 TaxID=3041785 RepID=UPI002790217F|nr:alpha/beta fold hydrolase [Microbacterium sp. SORGH_AS_1204]MDQ1136793.1 pimeloyl-ACP methyl ester carboxylesterase [Microbacterium sp. SORGH_AS_1204]
MPTTSADLTAVRPGVDPRVTALILEHRGLTLRGWQWDDGAPAVDAPRVLFVHGFSSTSAGSTQLFVQAARHLVSRGAVARSYDRLGQGVSDGDFFEITVRDEVDQVVAMIRETAGDGRVHVVAHSLGGVESALAAAREPDRVASVTLWSPAGVVVDDITVHDRVMGEPLSAMRERGFVDLGGMAVGPALVEDVRDGLDVYGPVAAYTGPVDVMHGSADEVVPFSYGQRYADAMPGGTMTLVDGADHGWSSLAWRRLLFDALDRRLDATA